MTIRFDPARGPDFRMLELRGRGTVGRRLSRALGVGALLKQAGWEEARREFLQGDASIRAYERLTRADGGTAILMISPPRPDGPILRYGKPYAAIAKLSPDIRAFIAMAGGLRSHGYSAPNLIAYSVEEGLALIEDFGTETVLEDGVPNGARYVEAIALLADLHGRELPDALPVGDEVYRLPTYDIEAMQVEVELALDWYAPAVARVAVPSGARMQFLALWRELLSPILASERPGRCATITRRTFTGSPTGKASRRIGLIDFQDAVIGPPAYDLASLLQDARIDVPDDLEMRLAALYVRRRAAADPGFDAESFAAAYAAMGAQRATKILGLFARLDKRDGKPQYLSHLPRIERYLTKNLAHPLLRPLALWYQNHLPRALGQPLEGSDAAGPSKRSTMSAPLPRPPWCSPRVWARACGRSPIRCRSPWSGSAAGRSSIIASIGWPRTASSGRSSTSTGMPIRSRRISPGGRPRRSSYPTNARRSSTRAAGSSAPCRPSGRIRSSYATPTRSGSRDRDRTSPASPQAFDPEQMDVALLVAAAAGAVGVDWPGDFTMTRDGRLKGRASRHVAPFVYTGVGIIKPELFENEAADVFRLAPFFHAAAAKGRLFGVRLDGLWLHVGRPETVIGKDPFFLCNTDAFWIEGPRSNIARLAAAFDPDQMDVALLVAAAAGAVGVDWPGDFTMTREGRLEGRASRHVAPFVYTGVGIIKPELFENEAADVFRLAPFFHAAAAKGRLFGVRLDGLWLHVGRPETIAEAEVAISRSTL